MTRRPAGFAGARLSRYRARPAYDARWVARFVSAYANADTPTGEALFGAAMADGQLSTCLMTLAGSTVRHHQAARPRAVSAAPRARHIVVPG